RRARRGGPWRSARRALAGVPDPRRAAATGVKGSQMPLRRYLGLFRPHLPGLALAAVLLGLSASLPGAVVWALRWLVDALLAGEPLGALPWILVGLALAEAAVSFARTALTKGIAWRVATDLRRRVHAHLLR